MKQKSLFWLAPICKIICIDEDDRKNVIRDLVTDISEQEKMLNHTNTIVVGDFNSSPFDNELIQKDAFNAVLFKELILETELGL